MMKCGLIVLVATFFLSCEKATETSKESEVPIELGFNTGFEAPSTDKPFYKSTDSVKFEMVILTNVSVPKNQIRISLGDESAVFGLTFFKTNDGQYVNTVMGGFKPPNKIGEHDLNIRLSNSKSEKLLTKKILILPELNLDDVLPEITRQRMISAFPLKYQFCNFTSEKAIASSNPTEIEMGNFNLDASTSWCATKRVFINGFNGEITINLSYDGKLESVSVKHGTTTSNPSLSLEKILAQLAPFYGAPIETGIKPPNTRFAKINTVKGIIMVYDNGINISSIIKLK